MILIAGLGNPGKKYYLTRHNTGFIVTDRFLESIGVTEKRRKFKSKTAQVCLGEKQVLIIQPLTYMNESGNAVLLARKFYKNFDKILVVYDDIDLEFGKIKFKKNGGSAGHKGIISILRLNPGVEFDRLRVGVGRPPGSKNAADYVLNNFSKAEQKEMDVIAATAVDALKDYIVFDVDFCMNKYNK